MWVCLVTFLLLNNFVAALNLGEDCLTPEEERGKCIRLGNCPHYSSLLTVQPVPSGILGYFRRAKCGTIEKKALFCCPGGGAPPKENGGHAVSPLSKPEPNPPRGEDGITGDISRHRNFKLLPLNLCGPFADDRIIRGKKTELNEMPWMVLISYTGGEGRPYKCTGSLITSRYVLTTANCVSQIPSPLRPMSVRLGEYDLDSDLDCYSAPSVAPEERDCLPEPQDIEIEEIIPHPKYVRKTGSHYDIALLRLAKPADFTPESVRPICLPVSHAQQTKNLTGIKMVVAGWGWTENRTTSPILLKTSVTGVSNEQCFTALQGQVPIDDTTQICAGGVQNGGDFCSGDSGSPLIYFGEVQSTIRRVQFGISSFGATRCGTVPALYTRVGHYMNWILDNMKP